MPSEHDAGSQSRSLVPAEIPQAGARNAVETDIPGDMPMNRFWTGWRQQLPPPSLRVAAACVLLPLLPLGCAAGARRAAHGMETGAAPAPAFHLDIQPADAEVAPEIEADLAYGRRVIETYFGMPFREDVKVSVFPSRADFTAAFPAEWGMTETACWMVAAGVADRLLMLSPRAWGREACEHDAQDAQHVRDIIVHELVHVFHGQHNPTRDFTGAEEVGWFAEGLAVRVSGQLDHGHLAEPREAIALGAAPKRLADAWSGKYRYGVSGSLVTYLDATFGRDAIRKMLAVTRQDELLAITGETEGELLAKWQGFALAAPATSPARH